MSKKANAKRELSDNDWKTQLARGYKNIPKGAEVEFIEDYTNLYGIFAKVRYDGQIYYVDKEELDFNTKNMDREIERKTAADKVRAMPKVMSATGQIYVDFEEVMKILEGSDFVER